MWGRRLAAMLALYTGKGVAPEVNLRERISRTPLHSSNKAEPTLALKPKGDVTRSPNQGYQWPHKWTCVQQKFKKKLTYNKPSETKESSDKVFYHIESHTTNLSQCYRVKSSSSIRNHSNHRNLYIGKKNDLFYRTELFEQKWFCLL